MKYIVLTTVVLAAGCATVRPILLDEGSRVPSPRQESRSEGADRPKLVAGVRRPVVGYVTSDGVPHRFSGFVERVGDSLVFSRLALRHGIVAYGRERFTTLPTSDVAVVRATYQARLRTALCLGATAGLGAAAVFVAAMNGGKELLR